MLHSVLFCAGKLVNRLKPDNLKETQLPFDAAVWQSLMQKIPVRTRSYKLNGFKLFYLLGFAEIKAVFDDDSFQFIKFYDNNNKKIEINKSILIQAAECYPNNIPMMLLEIRNNYILSQYQRNHKKIKKIKYILLVMDMLVGINSEQKKYPCLIRFSFSLQGYNYSKKKFWMDGARNNCIQLKFGSQVPDEKYCSIIQDHNIGINEIIQSHPSLVQVESEEDSEYNSDDDVIGKNPIYHKLRIAKCEWKKKKK